MGSQSWALDAESAPDEGVYTHIPYTGPYTLPCAPMLPFSAAPSFQPVDNGLHRCWGAELKGDWSACCPGFEGGKVHFKNKFCTLCRSGIDVPASQIRALSPELQIAFANSQSEGFWKTGPPHVGGGTLRIVNNTAACVGPWLAIYRSEPAPLAWGEIPAKWVSHGIVRLCVAKGTLVPDLELRGKSLMRIRDSVAPILPPAKCKRIQNTSRTRQAAPPPPLASEETAFCASEEAVPLHTRRNDALPSSHDAGPSTATLVRAPATAPALAPETTHGFIEDFVRAHYELVSLIERRLASSVTMPDSEREMLAVHLRLSKAVLRAASSDGLSLPEAPMQLAPDSQPNLTHLANVCVCLLDE